MVTGATFAAHPSPEAGTALLTAFGASVGPWWTYFGSSAEAGSRVIAASDDPGRLARSAYTFLHLPMVAGIVVSAVADELVIHHPGGHMAPGTATAILGGPALFLIGHALFRRAVWGRVPRSHLAGVLVLAALGAIAPPAPPLALAACATATVAGVAVWAAVVRSGEPQAA
ncbi:low temperature requirement protein A [Microbispora hainanensis]|uniref:Low temperature requirement protein A n=1 Tax=Microbispora hainanensis TaxID=568844 RepID=A0ABZ1T1M5_9ACTN|nr:low temperature requirement protein A [Microbispora hainanensis]